MSYGRPMPPRRPAPHREPDADDRGGKSDYDADNRPQPPSARRRLAEMIVGGKRK